MSELTNDQIAELFIETKAEAKRQTDLASKYQKDLDDRLADGDRVAPYGKLHTWSVSVAPSVPYKKVLEWVHARVGPAEQTLIEEGQNILAGTRTTKTLKAVKQ